MFSVRKMVWEDTFCFFEDLLFKLFETLRSEDFIQSQSWRQHHTNSGDDTARASRLGSISCPGCGASMFPRRGGEAVESGSLSS